MRWFRACTIAAICSPTEIGRPETFANLPPNLPKAPAPNRSHRRPVSRSASWATNGSMSTAWCFAGFRWTFTMGSLEDTPGRYPDEEQRSVTIEDGWMQKYELIRGQSTTVGRYLPYRKYCCIRSTSITWTMASRWASISGPGAKGTIAGRLGIFAAKRGAMGIRRLCRNADAILFR